MRTLAGLSIALLSVAPASFAATQGTPSAAADKPAMAASMPHDCKAMSKDMPCAADTAASGATAKKKLLKHDHGKFHKNQG